MVVMRKKKQCGGQITVLSKKMNKREVTKRYIRGQTCDTCKFNNNLGCEYGVNVVPITNQINHKDFPKERTCEHWVKKILGADDILTEEVTKAMKKEIDNKIMEMNIHTAKHPGSLTQMAKLLGFYEASE